MPLFRLQKSVAATTMPPPPTPSKPPPTIGQPSTAPVGPPTPPKTSTSSSFSLPFFFSLPLLCFGAKQQQLLPPLPPPRPATHGFLSRLEPLPNIASSHTIPLSSSLFSVFSFTASPCSVFHEQKTWLPSHGLAPTTTNEATTNLLEGPYIMSSRREGVSPLLPPSTNLKTDPLPYFDFGRNDGDQGHGGPL